MCIIPFLFAYTTILAPLNFCIECRRYRAKRRCDTEDILTFGEVSRRLRKLKHLLLVLLIRGGVYNLLNRVAVAYFLRICAFNSTNCCSISGLGLAVPFSI